MSKLRNPFFLLAAAFFLILPIAGKARAQELDILIKLDGGVISVQGKQLARNDRPDRRIYFAREYAGHDIPGERVSGLTLSDAPGRAVTYKQLAPGEFLADAGFGSWSYTLTPGVPKKGAAAAHVSWLADDRGMLMLDDILPKFADDTGKVSAKIEFALPGGWKISGAVKQAGANVFETSDVYKAVFFVGKGHRVKKGSNGSPDLIISGEWLFTDEEAVKITEEIYADHRRLFGAAPFERVQIVLSKFPNTERPGTWEAETRGNSVAILSADMPFQTQSVQKLHEQLRHEMFHLWVPNAVNLSGNYDWFYEGFALYQALRLGISANRIRFDDMLDTLSRAYNVDQFQFQSQRGTLIEASGSRWAGGNTQVYARGMIAAFLCDITMLHNSKGKTSVSDVLRRVYTEHSYSKPREDGNTAVLRILESYEYLRPLTGRYVRGSENIEWKKELDAVGLEAIDANNTVRLKVKDKLSGNQKAFLDKLGYNNWRKLSRNSK
jgi:predicted metalloprotease with PDZ domain